MKKLYTLFTLCLVSILTAGVAFAQTVLTSVDELSNNKVYTLVAPRAALSGSTSGLTTTTPDATDANQQFAVYKGSKGYYLYCLGTSKFFNYSGNSVSEGASARSSFSIDYLTDDACFAIYNTNKSSRYNINGEVNSILNSWGTSSWGESDKGNMFTFTEVGDLDAATLALVESGTSLYDNYAGLPAATNSVATVADLSNNKAYYIFTKDTSRGFWGYDADNSTERLTASSVSNTLDNDNLKFAILKSDKGNYYIYSIAAQKFVTVNGNGTGLSSFPVADSTRVISVEDDAAPFVLEIDGHHIGISPSYTGVGGIISFWQDLSDSGNRVGFADAGEFDPTEALEYIEAQESMFFAVSQNPAVDSVFTEAPETIEVTMNKAVADLAEGAKVVVEYVASAFSLDEIADTGVTVEKDADNNRKLIFTIPNKDAFPFGGEYHLVLKDAVAEDGTVGDVQANLYLEGNQPEETKNTFVYSSVTPSEDTPVAKLDYITITYPDVVGLVDNSNILDVLDAEGNVVGQATIDSSTEWNDVAITLVDAITENGVYTITVPSSLIYDDQVVQEDDDTWDVTDCTYNPEFTLTFTVDTSTGINKVEVLGAKANAYTLDGKKVNIGSKKGLFIINGKKVVK